MEPMATAETKLMTAEEFWEWVHLPENSSRSFELVRGEVVEMTKPGKFHGFVCANIAFVLGLFARERGRGYVCTNDTGVQVETDPDTVRGPDILFFEDVSDVEKIDRKYGTVPPQLAVEVLSPNDSFRSVYRRVHEQLDFGTPLVWVADPESRSVVVFRTGREDQLLNSNQEITGEDVLPQFRCRVAEFFAMPGAEPAG